MTRKNRYHILTDRKFKTNSNKYIFLDTETDMKQDGDLEIHTLKLGWMIYWNSETKEKEYKYFETSKEAWEYIEEKNKEDIFLYAHNMEFDFKIIDGYKELFMERGYTIKNFYIEGTVFMITAVKENKRIFIYDTMNYVPASLKQIGSNIGLNKQDINFKTCSKKKLSEYCKNDTEIIYLFIQKLNEFLKDNLLSNLRGTIGSTAFNSFKTKFYDKEKTPIKIHNHRNAQILERRAYKGGITDCFKVGTFKKRLYKLDINSMYPHIMKKYKSPIELVYYKRSEHTIEFLNKYIKDYHVIADMEIELPEKYAYILTQIKKPKYKKSIFLKGKITGQYCTPEIKFIMKYGKIHKINEISLYKKAHIFKDYVDFFYKMRIRNKDNKTLNMFCKLMLNTLYGKFGQKNTKTEIIREDAEINIESYNVREAENQYQIIHIGNKIFKQETIDLYDMNEDINSYDAFPAIAAMITSYARMYLVEIILKAKRINSFYGDTDSLIVNMEGLHNIEGMIDETALGMLKLEEISDKSTFYKPKFYDFNNVLKCKGVRRQHKKLKDNKEIMIIEQAQFIRFKSSLKSGVLNKQVVKQITKKITKKYDKGRVENKTVYPFSVKELEKLY